MKARILAFSLCALPLVSSLSRAQEYQVTFIIQEEGAGPVSDALIDVETYSHTKAGDAFGQDVQSKETARSMPTGHAALKAFSKNGKIYYQASKDGFYPSRGFTYQFGSHSNGQWLPWNPTLTLELRRRTEPIPLMSRKVGLASSEDGRLPTSEHPVGYDLEAGDWVAPYGKGQHADLLFQVSGQTRDLTRPYDARFDLTFSNPLDGLVLHPEPFRQGSALHMPRWAPESGYSPSLSKRQALVVNASGDQERIHDTPKTENYFIRVRTKTDSMGKIVSAHYAKVYRGFGWDPSGFVQFHYYFNPKPNDRNLEFDPGKNLLAPGWGTNVREP